MATRWQLRAGVLAACLLQSGCLRPLLGDEVLSEDGGGDAGAETDGLGATGGTLPGDSDSGEPDPSEGPGAEPEPTCHPSYDPCLPVAEDLNCSDVRALGVAPVKVIGPDDYGLDADHDGIGCEN